MSKKNYFIGLSFAFLIACTKSVLIQSEVVALPEVSSPTQDIVNLPDTQILFSYTGKNFRDSQWGKLTWFENALQKHFEDVCHEKSALKNTDGVFTAELDEAIKNLKSCFESQDWVAENNSAVTVKLWRQLLPSMTPPSVHERAFVLSLSHEATDYDRAEFNFGTSDSASMLTWGPYGATFGYGNEIGAILNLVQQRRLEILKEVFQGDHALLLKILALPKEKIRPILEAVFKDPVWRKSWKEHFAQLGAHAEVRQIYEEYALQSDQWLKPAMQRLYTLIPDARNLATEIDYAFFLDLAMHMSISSERVEKVQKLLQQSEYKNYSPAQRRRLIAINLVPSQQQQDRLGRNVVYYIDAEAELKISEPERTAWLKRSGLKASNVGLSDGRGYYPF